MSLNQSRIHPLPSQSNNNIAAAPPTPPPPPPHNDHHETETGRTRPSDLAGLVICIISVFVIFLVLYFVPKHPEDDQTVLFHVVNASLTQFDLTNNNDTLVYNLTVDVNVTSPNRNFSDEIFVYDEIEARAYYQGNRFDLVYLMPFYHDQKNRTTTIHTVFQGQAALLVPRLGEEYEYDSELRDRFYRDKSYGSFDIQVQLSLRIRYNLGRFIKSVDENCHWNVICGLRRIPLVNVLSSASSSSSSSKNGSSNNPTTVGGGSSEEAGFFLTRCNLEVVRDYGYYTL